MEITTDRLILRDFIHDDWPAVLAYQRDPRYLRYTHWTDRSSEDVQRFVQMFLEQQQARPRLKYQLAVVLKFGRQLIGNCGIRRTEDEPHRADIGYELSPLHWGQGYATEVACAIVRFGFIHLRVHRIWAWCIAENTASARVLEKLGMQREGRLRETEYFKDRWWDTLVYAILKDEWHG